MPAARYAAANAQRPTSRSSIMPACSRTAVENRRGNSPPGRKIAVNRRHHSPLVVRVPTLAPRRMTVAGSLIVPGPKMIAQEERGVQRDERRRHNHVRRPRAQRVLERLVLRPLRA